MTILHPVRQIMHTDVPLLENGDRMKQPEFHRRYLTYPDDVKFELVGGIVYRAPGNRWRHSVLQAELSLPLDLYTFTTPGVEAATNVTLLLGEESEPQPDLVLRITDEFRGQSWVNKEDFLEGPPELIAEVAYSSRSIEFHQKREDYLRAGVLEYLVLSIEDEELVWFHFPSRGMISPNRQGVYHSTIFPGLWIDGKALLARDSVRLQGILQQGLKSKPHAAFVKRLERARRRNS